MVVTDRKDLQKQLSETAALTGQTVRVGRNVAAVKKLLDEHGPGLVFAIYQKYGNASMAVYFGVRNTDESIVGLVDEAHRSHGNSLHAALQKALPECARIGFTGTPILMGDRVAHTQHFWILLDRYTLKEAEADGSVVPIRTKVAQPLVPSQMVGIRIQVFEDWFH